jgi:hypothetical protein
VSPKAKHSAPTTARTTNGKKRGTPPPSSNGESAQTTTARIAIENDLHAWLLEQAKAIRDRRVDDLDWENVAEELEGMARSEKHALTSHLRVMLTHLLKWAYQPNKRELHLNSWRASIVNSRQEIEDALEESPSLSSEGNLNAFMEKAYRRARSVAAAEIGLSDHEMNRTFPAQCPWAFAQFMTEGFLPEQQAAISTRH